MTTDFPTAPSAYGLYGPSVAVTVEKSIHASHTEILTPPVKSLHVGTPEKLSFVTQTTLSVDDASVVIAALKEQFHEVQGPKKDDICYATQNRQDAVKTLAEQCDVVIVVGSPNSSNSRRLKEVAIARGVASYLIDDPDEIEAGWLAPRDTVPAGHKSRQRIGVTAGASAPEILVKRVVDRIMRPFVAPFQPLMPKLFKRQNRIFIINI